MELWGVFIGGVLAMAAASWSQLLAHKHERSRWEREDEMPFQEQRQRTYARLVNLARDAPSTALVFAELGQRLPEGAVDVLTRHLDSFQSANKALLETFCEVQLIAGPLVLEAAETCGSRLSTLTRESLTGNLGSAGRSWNGPSNPSSKRRAKSCALPLGAGWRRPRTSVDQAVPRGGLRP
jgi:hypothetical protein